MTPRWEHYNKPSTATSVDSCHKMPLEEPQQGLFESKSGLSPTAGVEASFSDRSQPSTSADRFDKPNMTSSSSVNHHHAEPCNSSVARSDIGSGSVVACTNCGVTATPLWRRAPTGEIICNACGLYLKARNATRPTWLKRNTFARKNVNASKLQHRFVLQEQTKTLKEKPETIHQHHHQEHDHHHDEELSNDSHESPSSDASSMDRPQMVCSNCSTTTTPLWRRDEEGNTICNACGLYYKLHNVQRPVTMKRSVIKRRKRVHANIISPHHHLHHHATAQPIQQRRLCPKHSEPPMLTHDSSSSGSDEEETNERKRRFYEDGFRTVKRMQLDDRKAPEALEPTSLHHGPSPIASLLNPVKAHDDGYRQTNRATAAAAIATVSTLLNPHSDVQQTQKVLEAHRQELRREVEHLGNLLSKTHAVLDNLDQVMVNAGIESSSPQHRPASSASGFSPNAAASILGNLLGGGDPNATNALATILTLGAAAAAAQKESIHLAPLKSPSSPPCHRELPPTPPPCPILPYPMDRRTSASSDSR